MGNASDSHLLCWEAALLIGSFMLQASSAIAPVQGAVLGTADRQVKSGGTLTGEPMSWAC